MADTSIKISLELADAAAQQALSNYITKAGQADKASQKLKDSGTDTFSEIALSIGKAATGFDLFAADLAANVAGKAMEDLLSLATGLFNTFVVDGVKSAEALQAATNALNVSLAASGHYSEETSKDFQDFAEGLEQTTVFSRAAILQNAALIGSLGRLGTDGLKKATQASADLAAALGKTLPEASELVAKASEGNVQALNRLGLSIQTGDTHAQTFANTLAAIEARFGGAATAQINTYSGAILQASNSFEDLITQIGNAVVQNVAVTNVITAAGKVFNDFSTVIKNNQQSIKEFVAEGLLVGIDAFKIATNVADYFVRTLQVVYGTVQALSIAFLPATIAIRAMSVGFKQALLDADAFVGNTVKNLTALGDSGKGALSQISTELEKIQKAGVDGFNKLKAGADGSTGPIKNSTVTVTELTDAMKRQQEQAKSLAKSLIDSANDGKTAANSQLAIAKSTADQEQSTNKKLYDDNLVDVVQFTTKKAAIEQKQAASDYTIQKSQLDKQQDLLSDSFDKGLISEGTFTDAVAALKQKGYDLDEQYSAKRLALDAKEKDELDEAEKKLQAQRVAVAANTFGALSSLTQTKSRELFEIGKAASLAQSLINTYQAITATMAAYPYPLNVPLAIAQGIAGAVQVANIEQTSPSFESGGIVPGNSFSGDSITANVNSGEMILNRSQQKNLFDIANSGGAGTIDYRKLASAMASAIGAQPITVNVGGKTITSTLRDELRGGRRFQ